jgi:hypothetical protein
LVLWSAELAAIKSKAPSFLARHELEEMSTLSPSFMNLLTSGLGQCQLRLPCTVNSIVTLSVLWLYVWRCKKSKNKCVNIFCSGIYFNLDVKVRFLNTIWIRVLDWWNLVLYQSSKLILIPFLIIIMGYKGVLNGIRLTLNWLVYWLVLVKD